MQSNQDGILSKHIFSRQMRILKMFNIICNNLSKTLTPSQTNKIITRSIDFLQTYQDQLIFTMFSDDLLALEFFKQYVVIYAEKNECLQITTYLVFDQEQQSLKNLIIQENLQKNKLNFRQTLRLLTIRRLLAHNESILEIEQCLISNQNLRKNEIRILYTEQFIPTNLNDFITDMITSFQMRNNLLNPSYLIREKKIYLEKIEDIIKQLLQILWILEKSHVLHRNISLSNIFIVQQNKIKLSGFELARDFNQHISLKDFQNYKNDSFAKKQNSYQPNKRQHAEKENQPVNLNLTQEVRSDCKSTKNDNFHNQIKINFQIPQQKFIQQEEASTYLTYPLEILELQKNSIMSPESLLCLDYDYRIDSWSVGLIVFQILYAFYEEKVLITGTFESRRDQLKWILEFYGLQYLTCQQSFDFIGQILTLNISEDQSQIQFLFFQKIPEKGIYQRVLDKFSLQFRQIVEKLLSFNPKTRSSGSQLMKLQNQNMKIIKLPYELQLDELDLLQFLNFEEYLYRKNSQEHNFQREQMLFKSEGQIEKIFEHCKGLKQ